MKISTIRYAIYNTRLQIEITNKKGERYIYDKNQLSEDLGYLLETLGAKTKISGKQRIKRIKINLGNKKL